MGFMLCNLCVHGEGMADDQKKPRKPKRSPKPAFTKNQIGRIDQQPGQTQIRKECHSGIVERIYKLGVIGKMIHGLRFEPFYPSARLCRQKCFFGCLYYKKLKTSRGIKSPPSPRKNGVANAARYSRDLCPEAWRSFATLDFAKHHPAQLYLPNTMHQVPAHN